MKKILDFLKKHNILALSLSKPVYITVWNEDPKTTTLLGALLRNVLNAARKADIDVNFLKIKIVEVPVESVTHMVEGAPFSNLPPYLEAGYIGIVASDKPIYIQPKYGVDFNIGVSTLPAWIIRVAAFLFPKRTTFLTAKSLTQ